MSGVVACNGLAGPAGRLDLQGHLCGPGHGAGDGRHGGRGMSRRRRRRRRRRPGAEGMARSGLPACVHACMHGPIPHRLGRGQEGVCWKGAGRVGRWVGGWLLRCSQRGWRGRVWECMCDRLFCMMARRHLGPCCASATRDWAWVVGHAPKAMAHVQDMQLSCRWCTARRSRQRPGSSTTHMHHSPGMKHTPNMRQRGLTMNALLYMAQHGSPHTARSLHDT